VDDIASLPNLKALELPDGDIELFLGRAASEKGLKRKSMSTISQEETTSDSSKRDCVGISLWITSEDLTAEMINQHVGLDANYGIYIVESLSPLVFFGGLGQFKSNEHP